MKFKDLTINQTFRFQLLADYQLVKLSDNTMLNGTTVQNILPDTELFTGELTPEQKRINELAKEYSLTLNGNNEKEWYDSDRVIAEYGIMGFANWLAENNYIIHKQSS
jgi:hypothetical protein